MLLTSSISATTVYLVPVSGRTDVYSQYMYINSVWALLGETSNVYILENDKE